MQIKAQVMSDKMRTFPDKKNDNKPKTVRNLCLMDLDPTGHRMTKPVNVSVPLDDKVAGPAGQGTLLDAVVMASIERIDFLPWTIGVGKTPEIGFEVVLTEILGFQNMTPVAAVNGNGKAAAK